MARFGYKLMTETIGPKELVRNARLAEEAGFDFVSISDHYHPWLESHGHSPFAWSVLGAIAEVTKQGRDHHRVDLSDHSLSPRDHRAGGCHHRRDERRPVHAGAGRGRTS